VVDRFTNQLTLFNIIEQMQGVGPPPAKPGDESKKRQAIMPVNWCVTSFYTRSRPGIPETFHEVCVITGPRKKKIAEVRQEVQMIADERMRVISAVPHLPFAGFGEYKIDIFVEKQGKRRRVERIVIPFTQLTKPAIEMLAKSRNAETQLIGTPKPKRNKKSPIN
jgi:hypothetical protein